MQRTANRTIRRSCHHNLYLRLATLCLALPACLSGQPAIVGPSTGAPGQTLSYQLQDQGKPVAGVTWLQGFNPDRYTGSNYATSFRLAMTPDAEDGVQIKSTAGEEWTANCGSLAGALLE